LGIRQVKGFGRQHVFALEGGGEIDLDGEPRLDD
jgi:hypothetical protein